VREVAPPPPPPPEPEPVEIPAPEPEPEPEVVPAPEPEPEPIEIPASEPAPEPEPEPEPAPPAALAPDDLGRIKGLGPKLQALLPTLGVTSFAQIADWNEADLARIDPQLGPFAGRPVRDSWIEQAKFLAAGDVAGFEDRFGKV
jgi:predicted flap endonuclease-1-like 5' DNA nuclease